MFMSDSLTNLSPIILFVYNRPWHTKQTIEALLRNELAYKSDLFIYSDGPKNASAALSVSDVRSYIRDVTGFRNVKIVERPTNMGLSNSIISGVTEIINKYNKVIVLEDDMITSPYFLSFMNKALEYYRDKDSVWHISGWSYPVELKTKQDMYFCRVMEPWGWATWKDKWVFFEKNTNKLISQFSTEDIRSFNLDNTYNAWLQVILNKYNYIDTWGIYWYATIFQNHGLCLNPVKSYIRNIGLDGSGQNCKDPFFTDNQTLNETKSLNFIDSICEDPHIISQIMSYLKTVNKSIFVKLINKLSRATLGLNIIR